VIDYFIKKTIGQTQGFDKKHYPVVEGQTDKGTMITFFHSLTNGAESDQGQSKHNCHGYTFEETHPDETDFWVIDGYVLGKGTNMRQYENTDQLSADQSTAVKFILAENGYKQVHSIGSDGTQHYKKEYSPEAFSSSLPK
jgi:hypothetical protein